MHIRSSFAMMRYTACLVVVFLTSVVQCQNLTEYVETDKGPIQGTVLETVFHRKSYSAFFGVRFAKPPVGDLRFKDPVDPNPWKDVVNATKERDMCPQVNGSTVIGNEDCLYLTVYTPLLNFTNIKTLKPVMIWIFGGAFYLGNPSKREYGPDWFIEKGVIMVAINYRLGPLGFLALELSDARGNQGLKDQNLAMQWVQKNIAKFGGDPNRVTIMGESAGAVSVSLHMLSPRSRGLFQQAIFQSGSALCTWGYKSPKDALSEAYKLGNKMNIPFSNSSELLSALKEADVADIVNVSSSMSNLLAPRPIRLPFSPTSDFGDDAFLSNCPVSYLKSGNFSRVPTLMGYNADEAVKFAIVPDIERHALLQGLLKVAANSTDFKNIVHDADLITNLTEWTLIELATKYYFSQPIDITQRLLTKDNNNKPVYYYRLTYNTKYNEHKINDPYINGTAHFDDIPLLFYYHGYPTDPNNEYNVYSNRVVTMWANFIKYGDPTAINSTVEGGQWKPSGQEGLQLNIGNEKFEMHDRFETGVDEFSELLFSLALPTITC